MSGTHYRGAGAGDSSMSPARSGNASPARTTKKEPVSQSRQRGTTLNAASAASAARKRQAEIKEKRAANAKKATAAKKAKASAGAAGAKPAAGKKAAAKTAEQKAMAVSAPAFHARVTAAKDATKSDSWLFTTEADLVCDAKHAKDCTAKQRGFKVGMAPSAHTYLYEGQLRWAQTTAEVRVRAFTWRDERGVTVASMWEDVLLLDEFVHAGTRYFVCGIRPHTTPAGVDIKSFALFKGVKTLTIAAAAVMYCSASAPLVVPRVASAQ